MTMPGRPAMANSARTGYVTPRRLTPARSRFGIGNVPKLLPRKPLPRELVMDLIAITRLLWAKEQANGGHPMKLQEIADIGRSLKIALDMTKCEPGSMGMGVAWDRAEKALEQLGVLLKDQQVQPLLDTLGNRMLKIKRAF
jgi:hypothetical protein